MTCIYFFVYFLTTYCILKSVENKTLELFNNLILAVRLSDQSYIVFFVFFFIV